MNYFDPWERHHPPDRFISERGLLNRFTLLTLLGLIFAITSPVDAGIGIHSFGLRAGKDVVQGDDTRTFYMFQADIATLFSPRVLLEIAGETGSGRDLGGNIVEVDGGSVIFKYYWVNRKKNAYAFSGGGLGVNRYRRFEAGAFRNQLDTSIHVILLGMERHVWKKTAKGVFEIRWLVGNIEGASALRVTVGIGYIVKGL